MSEAAALTTKKQGSKAIYYVALGVVIVIWGIDPVVATGLYEFASPSAITAVGAFFSALFFMALAGKRLKKLSHVYFKTAIPISLITSAACLLQKIGLKFTTPASYAFLEHISCLVVPIVLFVLTKRKPTPMQLIAGIICLLGCFIFCGVADGGFFFGLGEAMCALAGVLFGVSVASMGVYTAGLDIRLYMTVHMWVYFLFSCCTAAGLNFVSIGGEVLEPFLFTFGFSEIALIILFGLVVIGGGWFLRTEAIVHTDPMAVAVISPLAAVVTAAVSIGLGMDKITVSLVVGAVIILVAAILSGIAEERALG